MFYERHYYNGQDEINYFNKIFKAGSKTDKRDDYYDATWKGVNPITGRYINYCDSLSLDKQKRVDRFQFSIGDTKKILSDLKKMHEKLINKDRNIRRLKQREKLVMKKDKSKDDLRLMNNGYPYLLGTRNRSAPSGTTEWDSPPHIQFDGSRWWNMCPSHKYGGKYVWHKKVTGDDQFIGYDPQEVIDYEYETATSNIIFGNCVACHHFRPKGHKIFCASCWEKELCIEMDNIVVNRKSWLANPMHSYKIHSYATWKKGIMKP